MGAGWRLCNPDGRCRLRDHTSETGMFVGPSAAALTHGALIFLLLR